MALPVLIAAAIGGLASAAASMVGRVLIAAGVTAVTYTGLSALLDQAQSAVILNFSGLGGEAVGILGLLKVGEAISIISGAWAARMVVSGLTSGTVTKWVTK